MDNVNKTILGHVDCPLCDPADKVEAVVRQDRNENPYIFCPICTFQGLTHGGKKAELLRKRMRSLTTVTDTVPLPAADPAPAAPPPAPAAPKPKPTPAPAPPPTQVPAPPPEPKKSAGWLTPLIGSGAR